MATYVVNKRVYYVADLSFAEYFCLSVEDLCLFFEWLIIWYCFGKCADLSIALCAITSRLCVQFIDCIMEKDFVNAQKLCKMSKYVILSSA